MWEIYDLASLYPKDEQNPRWYYRYAFKNSHSNLENIYRFREDKSKYRSGLAHNMLNSEKGHKLKPIYTCTSIDECFDIIQTLRLLEE